MADYPDLTESNRALRERFARNPVVPNTSTPDLPPDPGSGQNAVFGGFSSASPAAASSSLGQSIDDRLAARIAARDAPAAPTQGPISSSVIAGAYQDSSRQRDVMPTSGSLNTATVAGGDTQSVQVPSRVISQGGGYDPTQTQASLDSANARSRLFGAVAEQDNRNAQQGVDARNDRAQARFDAGIAERNAQVANFKAANSADVVLGDLGSRALARRQLTGEAEAANKTAGDIRARANAPIGQVGNIAAETAAAQDAASKAQVANQAGAESASRTALNQQQGVITTAQQKATLEQQQRINQLGSVLASSKDPSERQRASESILSLLGKDKPAEWKVIHAAGGTRVGPDGFTTVKDRDNVVLVNERTGQREVVQMGEQSGAAATPPENHVLALKQDPAKYKAQFEAKYGKGSADQYLK